MIVFTTTKAQSTATKTDELDFMMHQKRIKKTSTEREDNL